MEEGLLMLFRHRTFILSTALLLLAHLVLRSVPGNSQTPEPDPPHSRVWPSFLDMLPESALQKRSVGTGRETPATGGPADTPEVTLPVTAAFDPVDATLYVLVHRGQVIVSGRDDAPRRWTTQEMLRSQEGSGPLDTSPDRLPDPLRDPDRGFMPFMLHPRAMSVSSDSTQIMAPRRKMAADLYTYRNGTVRPMAQLLFDSYEPQMMDFDLMSRALLFWDLGAGKVHRLDPAEGRFERIDLSFSHRNMYGHASTIVKQGEWMVIGGFGNWSYKNLLVYFNELNREWLKTPQREPVYPQDSYFGTLVQLDEGLLEYLHPSLQHQGHHFKKTFSQGVWQKRQRLHCVEEPPAPPDPASAIQSRLIRSNTFMVAPTHRIAAYHPLGSKLHFVHLDWNDAIPYDLLTGFDDSDDPEWGRTVAFYRWVSDQWHLYHVFAVSGLDHPSVQERVITSAQIQSQMQGHWNSKPLLHYILPFWPLIAAIFVGLSVLTAFLYRSAREHTPQKDPYRGLRFETQNGHHRIISGDAQIELPEEESFQRLLKILQRLIESQTYEISIREIDHVLFDQIDHAAMRTRSRSKLISIINERVTQVTGIERRFLIQGRNPLDKRQRVLSLDRSFL